MTATATKIGHAMSEPAEIAAYFDRLFPLLRSLTGAGVRQSLDILGELMPLERIEIASGTKVFDWTVPQEWVVREAYLEGPDGTRIVDMRDSNLHLVNYSTGFRGEVSREELDEHLHSRADMPDVTPYVTSYYKPRWGFCLPHRLREKLPAGQYRVTIDAEHVDGAMSLGEVLLKGETTEEVLIASDICHPSLGNDELSGPLTLGFLYRRIAAWPKRKLTYRFVLHPETIGSIAYLSQRGKHLAAHCVAGFVVSNTGVAAPFRYKRSRRGNTLADRAAESVLRARWPEKHAVSDYAPVGSDERQYCSPGFDLPVGVLSRTPDRYPEYHTSLDNRDFVSFDALSETVDAYEAICRKIDASVRYRNLSPHGEPQLGPRGLYHNIGRAGPPEAMTQALLWVLNLSDGDHDLDAIAARSGIALDLITEAAAAAHNAGLLAESGAGAVVAQ
jgi:aminopeptidase-like protein